jgi:drug/metabolite transporter (DMT)-like permease
MNMIMNLSPLFTALLSWLILGEELTGIQVLAMLVIIGGVVIVQLGKIPLPALPGEEGGA